MNMADLPRVCLGIRVASHLSSMERSTQVPSEHRYTPSVLPNMQRHYLVHAPTHPPPGGPEGLLAPTRKRTSNHSPAHMSASSRISCSASSSCLQSSPDLMMQPRRAQPGRAPYGEAEAVREHTLDHLWRAATAAAAKAAQQCSNVSCCDRCTVWACLGPASCAAHYGSTISC